MADLQTIQIGADSFTVGGVLEVKTEEATTALNETIAANEVKTITISYFPWFTVPNAVLGVAGIEFGVASTSSTDMTQRLAVLGWKAIKGNIKITVKNTGAACTILQASATITYI